MEYTWTCTRCGTINLDDSAHTASPICSTCDYEPGWVSILRTCTDPYGPLSYAVGSADDFICFEYHIDPDLRLVVLHAVVNSETGSFIQNYSQDVVSVSDAVFYASMLVLSAQGWCVENDVEEDTDGWADGGQRFIDDLTKALSDL